MKTTQLKASVLITVLAFGLASCEKDDQVGMDSSLISGESINSVVEKTLSEDEEAAMPQGQGGGLSSCTPQSMFPSCVEVTVSGEEYPRTITIDWGNGCTDFHGRVRSGVMVITISDDMLNEGATRTVNFENYSVNGASIEGSRVTTNTGDDEDGHPTYSRIVDMSITHNGNTLERSFSGSVVWLSGFDTPECGDNIHQLTGTGSVVRPNGTTGTRTITEPLILDQACGHITSGVVEITGPAGTASIDYGDGSCDNEALLTRPDGSQEIIQLNP